MGLAVNGICFDCAHPASLAAVGIDDVEDDPTVVRAYVEDGQRWTVMRDPEGNELCVQSPR